MYIFNFKKKVSIALSIIAFIIIIAVESKELGNLYIKGGLILLIILLWVVVFRYYDRCPHCKKWGTMKTTNKELVDNEQTAIGTYSKEHGYNERAATMYMYHIHRKCKHCGYTDYIEDDVIKRN